jgi:hypothetical protein
MSDPSLGDDQLDGDLHSVTDDEYFAALAAMPVVRDADGKPVDVIGDVVDARQQKAEIEAAGGTWTPDDFLPGASA